MLARPLLLALSAALLGCSSESPSAADAGGGSSAGTGAGTSGASGGASAGGGRGGAGAGGGASGGTAFPPELPPEQLPRFVHYIRSAPFPRLVFELDAVPGLELRAGVDERLTERFAAILDKPQGIEVVHDDALEPAGEAHAWSDAALDELARASFDGDPGDGSIAIHVMVVDGHSERDGDSGVILGLAWGHLYVTLFKQTIDDTCGGLALVGSLREQACAEAELGILTHEVGHVLGLVDNGLPMATDHRDPEAEHGAHDQNQDCIMYWAYEGQALVDAVADRLLASEDDSLVFDAECLADIDAAR